MTMKIKAQLVKKLRKDRLWSQDELAKISGIGLRTIQRIETEGKASAETVKALAAVFEIESTRFLSEEPAPYKNIQLGGFLVLLLLVTIVLCVWLLEKGHMTKGLFTLISLSLFIPIFMLSTLTVTVVGAHVCWYFGPGFWKKMINLEQVNKTRVVRNKLWWGLGIRFYGGGWLYNISGLDAVELQLKDGSRIRIGSNEAPELQSAIADAMRAL